MANTQPNPTADDFNNALAQRSEGTKLPKVVEVGQHIISHSTKHSALTSQGDQPPEYISWMTPVVTDAQLNVGDRSDLHIIISRLCGIADSEGATDHHYDNVVLWTTDNGKMGVCTFRYME